MTIATCLCVARRQVGQDRGGFAAQAVVNELKLFQPPVVDCFEEAAFFDAVLGSDMFTGTKSSSLRTKNLDKMPARRMFFEMVED